MASTDRVAQDFLAAVGQLITPLGWQLRSFEREGEVIALAALDHDPAFEQMLWIYCPDRRYVRCLLVARGTVPAEREPAVVELCARINDGLVFGCAEYSFSDQAFVLRDSFETGKNSWDDELTPRTARLLELGSHYSPALQAVLGGTSAAEAIRRLEHGRGSI
jgi:hypothetical protein